MALLRVIGLSSYPKRALPVLRRVIDPLDYPRGNVPIDLVAILVHSKTEVYLTLCGCSLQNILLAEHGGQVTGQCSQTHTSWLGKQW